MLHWAFKDEAARRRNSKQHKVYAGCSQPSSHLAAQVVDRDFVKVTARWLERTIVRDTTLKPSSK